MGDPSDKSKRKKQKRSMSTGDPGQAAAGAGTDPNADDNTPVGRKWTLSIALPGSLLDNPPSVEAAVCTAAQIARAAAAFQVDEVVVYDDTVNRHTPAAAAATTVSPGTALLARLLQYFDTPPHLRPNLYDSGAVAAVGGTMEEFKLAAAMPQPSPPHHARPGGVGAWMPYREGVVLKSDEGAGSYVDVGLDRMVWLEHQLPQLTRVTVHLGDTEPTTTFKPAYSETMIVGQAVDPCTPRERLGLYWGYAVRVALGLHRVFKEGAVSRSGHYDLTVGSSPRGAPTDPGSLVLPKFKHALLVLGGGCPGTAGADKKGKKPGAANTQGQQSLLDLEELVSRAPDWEHKMPQDVFNLYLNTTPHLGTLRLRAEDALPIALSYLVTPLLKYGKQ